MRQTLFRIPLDQPWSFGPLEVPGFGLGIVLFVWILFGAWWLWQHRADLGPKPETLVPAAVWLAAAAAIVLLPSWVQRETDAGIERRTQEIQHGLDAAQAHYQRARLLERKLEFERAAEDYRAAIGINPAFADAHRSLAWLMATAPDDRVRDGEQAIGHAEQARDLTGGRDARALDALAAAYAAAGRFDEAVAQARQTAALANEIIDRRPVTAEGAEVSRRFPGIRQRLQSYLDGRPWTENPRELGVSLPVYGYGFMLFLAFFAAGWAAVRRARSVGVPGEMVWDLALWMFFVGIAGGRIFYSLQYPERVFGERQGFERVIAFFNLPDGGLVLYGGVLGGIAAYLGYCRLKKLSPLLMGDVIIPSGFIGLAFGRTGCFLNGCCYGGRSELPWAVEFPFGSVPDLAHVFRGWLLPNDVFTPALHPTQIYSTINALVLALLTHWYFRTRPRPGAVLAVGWLAYPVSRFLIEYLRSDEPTVVFPLLSRLFWGEAVTQVQTPFTISQWVSLGLFAAGLGYVFWWKRRK